MPLRENPGDQVVNEVKQNAKRLLQHLHTEYKTVKPFHKEPMTKQDQIAQFQKFTPQVEQMMRQRVGNEAVDAYKSKMTNLMAGGR